MKNIKWNIDMVTAEGVSEKAERETKKRARYIRITSKLRFAYGVSDKILVSFVPFVVTQMDHKQKKATVN